MALDPPNGFLTGCWLFRIINEMFTTMDDMNRLVLVTHQPIGMVVRKT